MTSSLSSRSSSALSDEILQGALKRATSLFIERRAEAITSVTDWEALRLRARAVKEHTINHLDYYLEQLVEKVKDQGGNVHWARTAGDVSDYIVALARARNITTVVKSKSMTTEEIELNHALEAAGIRPVETDLGEYIIQLAQEKPSHIIVPAIHKTRDQIADLFARELGPDRPNSVEEITATARQRLRNEFLSAGMGITGANFAIAETGGIVLVENEGNIRLSTQVPKVHVAVVGIEKVIPRVADLSVFLRLLPRSGTGQKQTAYVSFLNGPRSQRHDRGQSEFHLVLLDNGRIRILADEHMRESLYCIRCGACLNVCPVYQKIGGQAYGWIYPGPIGAVISPQLQGMEQSGELPFASTLCGACRDACPVAINLPDLLLSLRSQAKEGGINRTRGERLMMKAVSFGARHPKVFGKAGSVAKWLLRMRASDGKITSVPAGPLRYWTRYRDFAAPPQDSFRKRWQKLKDE